MGLALSSLAWLRRSPANRSRRSTGARLNHFETVAPPRPYIARWTLEAAMRTGLLRFFSVVGLVALCSIAPARADEVEGQARAVIQRQFDPFSHGDAAGAYALAAPGIKVIFPNSDVFMEMARTKYAPVYHHR